MGWKRVKEHYRIEHIVQVSPNGICIGSPYVPKLIEVGFDGQIIECYARSDSELMRYQAEIEADPETFRRLMREEDVFSASIPVYTFRGAEIIEKLCEEVGWPNVTHDGSLMYENGYSEDKATVVGWAKKSAARHLDYTNEHIEKSKRDLSRHHAKMSELLAIQAELDAAYPDVAACGYGEIAPQASDAPGEAPRSDEAATL